MPQTKLVLHRAVRKAGAFKKSLTSGSGDEIAVKPGVLYPDFEAKSYFGKKLQQTIMRKPDASYGGSGNVLPRGGTSLFDKHGVFGHGAWRYFLLPSGTVVPDSLLIRRTHRSKTYDADHYQIEVRTGAMTVEALQGALDNLARNALTKQHADAHATGGA